MDNLLKIADVRDKYGKVTLKKPSVAKYLLLAAEVDNFTLPFVLCSSTAKKDLLKLMDRYCKGLRKQEGVINATIFSASVMPPGKGRLLNERPDVHKAKFDVVLLIELQHHITFHEITLLPHYRDILYAVKGKAKFSKVIEAVNCRRIDTVDHSRNGIFLFNYFYADNLDQNLAVWEYTAGWFQKETGLDNSTVLLPITKDKDYALINHCRWNRLRDILPSLLFKRSFREFVLKNFYLNQVAPMPILYRIYPK